MLAYSCLNGLRVKTVGHISTVHKHGVRVSASPKPILLRIRKNYASALIAQHRFYSVKAPDSVPIDSVVPSQAGVPPPDISVDFIEDLIPFTWWSIPIHIWLIAFDDFKIPVYGSVILGTILLRASALPLVVQQFRNSSILNLIAKRAKRYQMKEKQASKVKDYVSEKFWKDQYKSLYQSNNAAYWKNFYPMTFIGPTFVIQYWCIRYLLTVSPQLFKDGPLWLQDLTIPDPYFVLPVVYILLQFVIVMKAMPNHQSILGDLSNLSKPKWAFLLGTTGLLAVLISQLPSIFSFVWLPSMLITLGTNLLFKDNSIRRLFHIPIDLPFIKPERKYLMKKPEQASKF